MIAVETTAQEYAKAATQKVNSNDAGLHTSEAVAVALRLCCRDHGKLGLAGEQVMRRSVSALVQQYSTPASRGGSR